MKFRALAITALIPALAFTACSNNDNNTTAPVNNATVRFVNATNSAFDVATNGSVGTGNGNLAYGASGSCTAINASSPNLSIRQAGTTTTIPGFTPNFTTGGNYTVVAYTGATGTTQFVTLNNAFTPASGQSGLRVFNGTSTSANGYDVYVTAPGAALPTTANASGVGFGSGSSFFNVGSGSQQIRFTNAGSTTVAGNFATTFTAGQNSVFVIAPPATGTTAPRAFFVGGC